MRVLAINQFYAPDHAATSQMLTELCEGLVALGDEVTVIASRGGYLGGGNLPAHERIGGVEVHRPWATRLGKASVPRRLADYSSFWASAVAQAVREARPDVILALTTPPMIAAGAALVARGRGVPLVTWVQDVYPEVAAAFGVLSEQGAAYRALRLTARATHGATARIVALSQGMAERLVAEQGAPRSRVRVVHNWADGTLIRPLPHAENPFRHRHGLEDRFVAMYSGNLGVGHELGTFVEAAKILEHRAPQVLFLFVGEGAGKAEAERLARGLGNVRFLPYQPREKLAESLSAADVHLVSLRPGLEGLLVPSKLYGALASGRPVLYVGPVGGEVARVVREHRLGWEGRPGAAAEFAEAVCQLEGDPGAWSKQCVRARSAFDEHFDRPRAVRRWRSVLEEAIG